jgi:hypothetical protein
MKKSVTRQKAVLGFAGARSPSLLMPIDACRFPLSSSPSDPG